MKTSERLVSRITELDRIIKTAQNERAALVKELAETPAALLDHDPEAELSTQTAHLNDYLEKQGLLPPQK